jgi:hypothetical protein
MLTINTLLTTENLQEEQDFIEVNVVALSSTCVVRQYGNLCFPDELLQQKAKDLIGKPVLLDHEWKVGSVVGVVKDAFYQDGKIIAKLQIIKAGNEKLINLLKLEPKPITDVSVGITLETEKLEEGKYIVKDMSFKEISFVFEGADKNAKVLFEADTQETNPEPKKDFKNWWDDPELRDKAPRDYFLDPSSRKYPYRTWDGQISCDRLQAAMSLASLHGHSRVYSRAKTLHENYCKGGVKNGKEN